MSNEQEMREAIKESISDFRKSVFEFALKQDKENHEHMIQAQINVFNVIDSATLAAEARIRDLEADARRYRFIRNDEIQPKDGVPFICVYQGSFVQLTLGVADEQIDAAINENKENQG